MNYKILIVKLLKMQLKQITPVEMSTFPNISKIKNVCVCGGGGKSHNKLLKQTKINAS